MMPCHPTFCECPAPDALPTGPDEESEAECDVENTPNFACEYCCKEDAGKFSWELTDTDCCDDGAEVGVEPQEDCNKHNEDECMDVECEECDPCKKSGPQCGERTLPACDGEDCTWTWSYGSNKWVVLLPTDDNCGALCDCGTGPSTPGSGALEPPQDLPCEPAATTTEHDSLEVVSDVTVSVDSECMMTISVSKVKYVLEKSDCGISALVSDGTTDTKETNVDICDCEDCDEPAPENCPERSCLYIWESDDHLWKVLDSSDCTTNSDTPGCCCPSHSELEDAGLTPGGGSNGGTPGPDLPEDQLLAELNPDAGDHQWNFPCNPASEYGAEGCPQINIGTPPGPDPDPPVTGYHLECLPNTAEPGTFMCQEVPNVINNQPDDCDEGLLQDCTPPEPDPNKHYVCEPYPTTASSDCKCVEKDGAGTNTGGCDESKVNNSCECESDPDPNPQTQGACCIDGTCSIRTNASCLAAGGTYTTDGTGCTPYTCGPPPGTPTGACCDSSGDCTDDVTEDDCNGTWHDAASCSASTCCGNCIWSWSVSEWNWLSNGSGCGTDCECASNCNNCGNGFPGVDDQVQPCVSTSGV